MKTTIEIVLAIIGVVLSIKTLFEDENQDEHPTA